MLQRVMFVNEDVVDNQRRIRKLQERIEHFRRAGLDISGLMLELKGYEDALVHLMHHREVLARSVA